MTREKTTRRQNLLAAALVSALALTITLARAVEPLFAMPGVYPALVRFANADLKLNSDFQADVRSLSFSADFTREVNNRARQLRELVSRKARTITQ
jgi:uncharacterized protein YycO